MVPHHGEVEHRFGLLPCIIWGELNQLSLRTFLTESPACRLGSSGRNWAGVWRLDLGQR